MKFFIRCALTVLLTVVFEACFAGQAVPFSFQKNIVCTDNILRQIYPNQNACQLQESIPSKLQGLPFVIYPTQIAVYNTARFNFNKRFNVFPKAIIVPKSHETLAKVVKYLKKKGLRFSVRSGGHCFEPGSLSSDYILDLERFDAIGPIKDKVYIGAGARLGSVIEALGKRDQAIPTGTCQSVGIAGLALGGGIGFLSRTFGLTCDAIESITFLDANSNIIEVDKDNDSDLFWALRGAGNNSYGVALGFTFKTFYVPAASFFELQWEWDPLLVHQIVDAWHAWIAQLPNSINPNLVMKYSNHVLSISIEGLKVGGQPFMEWKKAFEHLNPKVTIHTGRYVDLAQFWADSPTAPFSKVKSIMAFDPIHHSAIQLAIDYLEQLRMDRANFQVSLGLVALGGNIVKGDTAFFPRRALEWWHQVANWNQQEQEAAAIASINGFHASVVPLTSNFCYSNSVDYDLGNEYLNSYYGTHVERLINIKNKYDPQNVFHWNQSIPLNSP